MNFTRQLGGALGTGLLSVLLERRTILHGEAFAATQTTDNAATAEYLGQAGRIMGQLGLSGPDQGAAAGWLLGQAVYAQSSAAAFRDGFLITAIAFVAAIIPTIILQRAISSAGRNRLAPNG
jgi:hypothetical protein